MISTYQNSDCEAEVKNEKYGDFECDSTWKNDANSLLNPNLWYNTIPIEFLYPNNSPDSLEDNLETFCDERENINLRLKIDSWTDNFNIQQNPNNDKNNVFFSNSNNKYNNINNNNNKNKKVDNINDSTNNSFNFDDFLNNHLNNNTTDIDSDNTSYNNTTDYYNNYNNNNSPNMNSMNNNNLFNNIRSFGNMYSNENREDNDKGNYNVDISEWLKEQNNRKLNTADKMNIYNMAKKEQQHYNHNSLDFLNPPNIYSSSTSPTLSCSPVSINSISYNSPLTCVLLSSSFYANSPTHQHNTSPYITLSVSDSKEEQSDLMTQVKTSIPHVSGGGEYDFDASKRCFSVDELKVSTIIPKSQKKFVPTEKKDGNYWSRRLKNNKAAKRSREAKRQKNNQINMRTAFLEDENAHLRNDVTKLITENKHFRMRLAKYEMYDNKCDVLK